MMSGIARALAFVLALLLTLQPSGSQAQPSPGYIARHGLAVVATLRTLTSAAMFAGRGSAIYRTNLDLLRVGLKIHVITGRPVVLSALRQAVALDPTKVDDARELAAELGLDPSAITAAAPTANVLAEAKAEVEQNTQGCSCTYGVLYRGDRSSRPIVMMFTNGFPAEGTNPSLLDHAKDLKKDSFYVSTSRLYNIAAHFANENGNVFFICSARGIDVNLRLGADSPYPEQFEVAFPGTIFSEEIVGAASLKSRAPSSYQMNPHFRCP